MSRAALSIIGRELRAAFLAPIGYIVAIVFLVMTGWLFMQPFFLGRAGRPAPSSSSCCRSPWR